MSTPAVVTDFLALARKSGVLDEKKLLEHFPTPEDLPRDPHACATMLLRAGLLTSFQAQQLLAGKYRGFLLGAYKVLQPIGKGGMGAVFLGEHTGLKRKVALKVLPADKASEKLTLERFQREARSSAALDHPNIVRLHDISQGCGVHFLVLEYVDGTDLQSLMAKTGPLHYAQAAQYVAQAAAGLQHAHEKGFVHRDVKPANLMLAKDGTIKILDMGLTRSFLDAGDDLTGLLGDASDVAGTADYIAPEQAMNKPVDERSDIYSLGATLFSLVTGHPPFKGSTAQKLMQHQVADPPSLFKLRGVIPQALSDVVARMMAKRPSDRYQSAAEVIDALGPWLPAPTTGNIVQDPFSTSEMRVTKSLAPLGGSSTTRTDGVPTATSSPTKLLALIGGGVVTLVLILGLGTWATFGGGKTDTNPTGEPNRDLANLARPPQGLGTAPKPLATPRLPATSGTRIYAVDFTGVPLASQTVDTPSRSLFLKELGGVALPDGVHVNHWNTSSSGVYSITEVAGVRAVGLRQTNGTQGVQVHFKCNDRLAALTPGTLATVRITYSLDGTGEGAAFVELTKQPYTKYAMTPLTPTGGSWQTVDLTFVRPQDGTDYDVVTRCAGDNTNVAQGTIRIRSVEVFEGVPSNSGPPPSAPKPVRTVTPGKSIYALDLATVMPFRTTYQDGNANDSEWGTRWPNGVYAHCWKKESVAEFRGDTTDRGPAVGVTNLNDVLSSQILFHLEGPQKLTLDQGKEYLVRVEYRAMNDATGKFWARLPGPDYTSVATAELVGTGGQWKTTEFTFRRDDKPIELGLENTAIGEGNTLSVRRVEVFAVGQ